MFIGHYGPALALAPVTRRAPLWVLFVAVQLVDYGWALLVALGVEKVRVEPGFTAMSPFDLTYMPYTHSLAAVLVWALVAGLVWRLVSRQAGLAGAAVVALAVLSHWLGDLLVHVPDLPLWPGGPKVGLGLWNNPGATLALEGGVLFAGFALYLAATRPRGVWGRVAPIALLLALAGLEAVHLTAPPPTDMTALSVQSVVAFTLLAALAGACDATRAWKTPPSPVQAGAA